MALNALEEGYVQCPIWKVFVEKSNEDQISFVKNLLDYAIPLLGRFSDTFPRYTDHGGRHQINILNIISELLGDKIQDFTSLEACIIILSAYYHDIGMIYTDEEKSDISEESDFKEFIKHDPTAELLYIENDNQVSSELGEWYCRWAHAKRVYLYLNKIENKRAGVNHLSLNWNNRISIRTKLGLICESHNWNVERLKDDDFDTSFLDEADLRFCAILLRLGDVLDFDYSRAEESIYNYLKLNSANSESSIYSKKEWDKHISSQGFSFPSETRSLPYEIKFIAAPSKPETEIDILDFLDYIDSELEQCRRVLQYCSNKWRNIFLPDSISKNILSQGYRSGEFKFTLDQKQVLDLLMGEQIYDNKYVFVRDLLQNALDTTRHKVFYERSNGQQNFEPKPIEVTSWIDSNGYKWIRFDDYGVGMNENIIKKYLLKVGSSYYNSAEFKVEKLGYKKDSSKDFTPISRFGIGLLSSFMVGDRVEISTWKRGSNPVRLSIAGLHNYYVLQTGNDIPSEMPSELKLDDSYRNEEGTSIAVRIDPFKESSVFKLDQLLEKWLFSSMVPVKYKGTIIGGNADLISKPLIQHFEEYIDEESITKISNFLGQEIKGRIGITGYPIDLTNESLSPYLKGQLIVFKIILPEDFSARGNEEIFISFTQLLYGKNYATKGFCIESRKEVERNGRLTNETISIPLPKLDELFASIVDIYKFLSFDNFHFDRALLIHNNIVIDFVAFDNNLFGPSAAYRPKGFMIGFISLYDELRPDINVARDKVEHLNWRIYSQIDLAFIRHNSLFEEYHNGILNEKYQKFNLSELSINNILHGLNEDIINTLHNHIYFTVEEKEVTFEALKSMTIENTYPIEIEFLNRTMTLRNIAKALIKTNFNINFHIFENNDDRQCRVINRHFVIINSDKPILSEADRELPPFFFMKFQGSDKLYFGGSINSEHRLGKWLRDNFIYLSKNYLGFLNDLIWNIRTENYYHPNSQLFYDEKVESINAILTRLMRLSDIEYQFKPSYEIFLKLEDFYSK